MRSIKIYIIVKDIDSMEIQTPVMTLSEARAYVREHGGLIYKLMKNSQKNIFEQTPGDINQTTL
jgi:hypothetical protein